MKLDGSQPPVSGSDTVKLEEVLLEDAIREGIDRMISFGVKGESFPPKISYFCWLWRNIWHDPGVPGVPRGPGSTGILANVKTAEVDMCPFLMKILLVVFYILWALVVVSVLQINSKKRVVAPARRWLSTAWFDKRGLGWLDIDRSGSAHFFSLRTSHLPRFSYIVHWKIGH